MRYETDIFGELIIFGKSAIFGELVIFGFLKLKSDFGLVRLYRYDQYNQRKNRVRRKSTLAHKMHKRKKLRFLNKDNKNRVATGEYINEQEQLRRAMTMEEKLADPNGSWSQLQPSKPVQTAVSKRQKKNQKKILSISNNSTLNKENVS